MNELAPISAHASSALITAAGKRTHLRFLEFFTVNIRNRNTRRAYAQATQEFLVGARWQACGQLAPFSLRM